MIRIDLHVHTFYSGDSKVSPRLLVDILNSHPLVKAVAITDHDTLEGYKTTAKLAKSYEDVLVIPGIEISAFEGHVIVLGVEEKTAYPMNVEEVVDFARERDGVIVVPHPYRVCGLGDLAKGFDVDAIETLNYRCNRRENELAEKLAREMNLPGVAGSDAHRHDELLRVYTEIEAEHDLSSILKGLRRGLVKVKALKG